MPPPLCMNGTFPAQMVAIRTAEAVGWGGSGRIAGPSCSADDYLIRASRCFRPWRPDPKMGRL